jgi:hypothetical protein
MVRPLDSPPQGVDDADLVAIQTYGKDAAITPKKLDFVEKRDLQSSKSGRRLVRSASP